MLIVRPELYKRTRIAICVCGFCASLQIESIILLGPRMGGKLSPCSIPDGTLCIINKRHEIRDLTRNAQQSRMSPSRAIVCVCVGKHHMTPPWLINYALAFLFSLHTFMQFIITALRSSAEKSTRWNTNCLFLHTPIYLSIYAYTSDLFTEGGAHVYCGQHTHTLKRSCGKEDKPQMKCALDFWAAFHLHLARTFLIVHVLWALP